MSVIGSATEYRTLHTGGRRIGRLTKTMLSKQERVERLTLSVEFPDYRVYKGVLWGDVSSPDGHLCGRATDP